jgi:hypothetical protein
VLALTASPPPADGNAEMRRIRHSQCGVRGCTGRPPPAPLSTQRDRRDRPVRGPMGRHTRTGQWSRTAVATDVAGAERGGHQRCARPRYVSSDCWSDPSRTDGVDGSGDRRIGEESS